MIQGRLRVVVLYKPLEPREGKPRQANKAHYGLQGAIRPYSDLDPLP